MKASVLLPTKDRGPAIAETIDSLLALDFPVAEHEIVIVDNLSGPENQRQLQGFQAAHPERIRYVREEKLGLNNARNRGIQESRGSILAFLDDDAVVPSHWLANIVEAFEADPNVHALGGKVIARFTTPPPEWIDQRLSRYISDFDHGERPKPLHYSEYPRGANMAFRREVFERCGLFLDCFDRKGDSLMSYGDIEMCFRIEQAGLGVLYVPDAEVHHLIRGNRLTEEWFLERFYWQGRSEGLFERLHHGALRVLADLPRHLVRSVLGGDRYRRRFHRGHVHSAALNLLRTKFE